MRTICGTMLSCLTRKLKSRYKTLIGLITMLLITWVTLSSLIMVNQQVVVNQRSPFGMDDIVQKQIIQQRRRSSKFQLKDEPQRVRLKLNVAEDKNDNTVHLIFNDDNELAELSLPKDVISRMSLNLTLEFSVHHNLPRGITIDAIVPEFAVWKMRNNTFCRNKLVAFANEFAFLENVVVDRTRAHGRRGGEELQSVINQPEKKEYFKFDKGFFRLPCKADPSYKFANKNHLNQWISVVDGNDDYYNKSKIAETKKKFTLAITRYEFANLYHTMTDFYNAFLMIRFFNKKPDDTTILFVDGHPKGSLDSIWSKLFNEVQRLGHMSNLTKYSELVWAAQGYNSPMNHHKLKSIPLVEDFREFFLARHNVTARIRPLNCSNVQLLFIWRHDYVAHPRNPSGSVSRKIKNEQELVNSITNKYHNIRIKAIQIDKFDMASQLKMVNEADILVGMHGAGLSHTLFLPKHAGVIEFYPAYWASSNIHFKAMAHWRKLHYERWVNRDRHNESPNHYTRIPPGVMTSLLQNILNKLKCQAMFW
ncbi:uncharacterized protein LOC141902861 [Tubulanus polymorphus]|uniref:uncharacterized protein LOC141902861 n=1 Tax=Tubulanus polymorphus TaxID=672921 RepID=UPI003DA551F8